MSSTHIFESLLAKKPHLYCDPQETVAKWRQFWDVLLSELPQMYKNKETWVFPHRYASRQSGKAICSAGSDERLQEEFASLVAQGLEECDCAEVNAKKFYCLIDHPAVKSRLIRCDFQFKRFLGKETDGEPPKGAGLCPILWGLGVMADGLTYVNMTFTLVPKTKELVGLRVNLGENTVERSAE